MTQIKQDRLCIYFFYDEDGIVDDYVIDCLSDVSVNVSQILVVSNSKLTESSKKRLSAVNKTEVVERDNIGFDVWAYKYGIDYLGWDKITSFDEVIFMNFTIVGPIYPFSEMFNEMATREIDFWGINVHSGESFDPWGIMPDGVIPKHLQSHFIGVRKRMLESKQFKDYWNNMRPIASYQEAIGCHEAIFTQKFEKSGFEWDSYIDTKDLEWINSYPLMFMPGEVIGKRRCPVFKRKALFLPMNQYVGNTMGDTVTATIRCLHEAGYDLSRVMPHILRSSNQHDTRLNLAAISILGAEGSTPIDEKGKAPIVVVHVDTEEKKFCIERYIETITENAEVVIVSGMDSLLFKGVDNCRLIKGDYLDFLKQIQVASRKAEVVGIIGFTEPVESKDRLGVIEFFRHGLESMYSSSSIIKESTRLLVNSDDIGVLAAPKPLHGVYGDRLGEWNDYYEDTALAMMELKLNVKVDADISPLTATNGVFWVKSSVFSKISWTKLAAVMGRWDSKRAMNIFTLMIPFIAQSRSLLTHYGMSDATARGYMNMLMYKLSLTDDIHTKKYLNSLNKREYLDRIYLIGKDGINEDDKITGTLKRLEDGTYLSEFIMSCDVDSLRYDPTEGVSLVCKGGLALVNSVKTQLIPMNAQSYGDDRTDIFVTGDPQYSIPGPLKKGDKVSISFREVEYFSSHSFLITSDPDSAKQYGRVVKNLLGEMQEYYESRLLKRRSKVRLALRKFLPKRVDSSR